MDRYLPVNLLGPGPRLIKKRIYWAVVSQRLRNTALEYLVILTVGRCRLVLFLVLYSCISLFGVNKDLFLTVNKISEKRVLGVLR